MILNFKVMDRIRVEIYDEDGNVSQYRETYDPSRIDHRISMENGESDVFANDIILDGGLADIVRMITERYGYVSVGTGTTAPEHDDTELESECMSRSVAATSISTTFFTNDTANFSSSFSPISNYSISESGIHVASGATGDVMLARETFVPMAVVGGRTFNIAWSIIIMR